jgi:outer membrane protein OmpA-like peptidoglycan-associated protein
VRFVRLISSASAFALASLVCTVPSFAQDVEGSKDHPMFSRMPSYQISGYDATDFGAHEFELQTGDPKKVEGKYWHISYSLKEGARKSGPLQIGRNYTDPVVKRGGTKHLEILESGGGSTTVSLPGPGGKGALWLQVNVSNSGELYDLYIVEEAAMKQEVEFTAGELADALKTKGSVALHNILFDTGKATIKPESAAALAPVGELLTSDPSLKLEIQGHTDNAGAAAANLKLSQGRAAAVKAYLVQTFAIGDARLTTAGFGDSKPIADNATEEGRARNRRVELVKK